METECASCEVRTGLLVLLQVASISQLTVSRLSGQCGIFNISQPYRPPRPVTVTALLYLGHGEYRHSSVDTGTSSRAGVQLPVRARFLSSTGSTQALKLIRSRNQWVPGYFPRGKAVRA
jgi:hypothetical protein